MLVSAGPRQRWAPSILNECVAGHVGPTAFMPGIGEKLANSTHALGLVDNSGQLAHPVPKAAFLDTESSDLRQLPTCHPAQDRSEFITAVDVLGHRAQFSVTCLN